MCQYNNITLRCEAAVRGMLPYYPKPNIFSTIIDAQKKQCDSFAKKYFHLYYYKLLPMYKVA